MYRDGDPEVPFVGDTDLAGSSGGYVDAETVRERGGEWWVESVDGDRDGPYGGPGGEAG